MNKDVTTEKPANIATKAPDFLNLVVSSGNMLSEALDNGK